MGAFDVGRAARAPDESPRSVGVAADVNRQAADYARLHGPVADVADDEGERRFGSRGEWGERSVEVEAEGAAGGWRGGGAGEQGDGDGKDGGEAHAGEDTRGRVAGRYFPITRLTLESQSSRQDEQRPLSCHESSSVCRWPVTFVATGNDFGSGRVLFDPRVDLLYGLNRQRKINVWLNVVELAGPFF